jgi:hypothetical protein
MSAAKLKFAVFLVLFIALVSIAIPLPARADGGPVVPLDLWANLKEGHQVAVVTILNENTARVDLFISILDKTSQSHEVTFFVPIGTGTSEFYAVEENLLTFDTKTTRNLDGILRQSADDKKHAVQVLFSGALLTNGALLVPFWAPVLLTGCAATEPKADVTLQTESSQISIYGIDENTDLDALIQTTGLPGSVSDTLSKLKGQQIAVVKLQTHPQDGAGTGPSPTASEPGLHLSWKTTFVPVESRPTYSYPLGTGASWSKPIELTRVYIVAPKGMDFDVKYPALGSEQSGFDIIEGARISQYYQIPSYAVDGARGDFGRVWRATYTQSNPVEDIVIVAKKQSALSKFMAGAEDSALISSFFFAIIIGLLVWIFAWTLLMPRFLGQASGQQPRIRWYYSLIYPCINIVFMVFPGSILYILFLIGVTIPSLMVLFVILGGAIIGFFTLFHGGHLGVARGKAILAFILTSLVSSTAYLILAVVFAVIVNVI